MKKVIVTGGAGFIGSHIVDALIENEYEVHVIDNLYSGNINNLNNKAVFHEVDIRDKDKIIPLFKDVDFVFHESAIPQVQYSIENPIETNEVNVVGLLNVLEASKLNNVKRLVFASSSAIYGNQEKLPLVETMETDILSPYGAHKYIGEVYCKLSSILYGLETVCLRYFNVYGTRQSSSGSYASVIAKFLELKKNNLPLTIVGNGEQTRDFINIKDIVDANLKAMLSDKVKGGEIINIGSGKQTSVNDIAKIFGGETHHIENRIEPTNSCADITKAKELLSWQPEINLEEGLKDLLES